MMETLPYHTDSGMYVLLTPSDLIHVNAISKNGDSHVRNYCYQPCYHQIETIIISVLPTTKLSIIRIQVLNTGDDSVILILGTGLTSWLLPNEGECGHDHQIVHRTSFIDSVIIVMMINDSDEDHVGLVGKAY